jgi:hypothetical protein
MAGTTFIPQDHLLSIPHARASGQPPAPASLALPCSWLLPVLSPLPRLPHPGSYPGHPGTHPPTLQPKPLSLPLRNFARMRQSRSGFGGQGWSKSREYKRACLGFLLASEISCQFGKAPPLFLPSPCCPLCPGLCIKGKLPSDT